MPHTRNGGVAFWALAWAGLTACGQHPRLESSSDPSLPGPATSTSALPRLSSPQTGQLAQPPNSHDRTVELQLDWMFPTSAGLTSAPALLVPGYPIQSNTNDRLIMGGALGSGNAFFGLYHLYNECPDVCFTGSLPSVLYYTDVALSIDGSTAYIGTKDGTLSAISTSSSCGSWAWSGGTATCDQHTGTAATAMPMWQYNGGHQISHSSPWVDPSGYIFYGDVAGNLQKVVQSTGQSAGAPWPVLLDGSIHNTPLVWNGVVWAGTDKGSLFPVDMSTGAILGPGGGALKPCSYVSKCGTGALIYSSAAVDTTRNILVDAIDGYLFTVDLTTCNPSTGCASPKVTVASILSPWVDTVVWSSPSLDWGATQVWIGNNNQLLGFSWPLAANATPLADVPLPGSGGETVAPRSAPLVWQGSVFSGNSPGYIAHYAINTGTLSSLSYGAAIYGYPVVDYLTGTGHIYFGLNGSNNALVQISQSF